MMFRRKRDVSLPLDGLGLDERAMLDLVNRMNENLDGKWVLVRGCAGGGQMMNPFLGESAKAYSFNRVANVAPSPYVQ